MADKPKRALPEPPDAEDTLEGESGEGTEAWDGSDSFFAPYLSSTHPRRHTVEPLSAGDEPTVMIVTLPKPVASPTATDEPGHSETVDSDDEAEPTMLFAVEQLCCSTATEVTAEIPVVAPPSRPGSPGNRLPGITAENPPFGQAPVVSIRVAHATSTPPAAPRCHGSSPVLRRTAGAHWHPPQQILVAVLVALAMIGTLGYLARGLPIFHGDKPQPTKLLEIGQEGKLVQQTGSATIVADEYLWQDPDYDALGRRLMLVHVHVTGTKGTFRVEPSRYYLLGADNGAYGASRDEVTGRAPLPFADLHSGESADGWLTFLTPEQSTVLILPDGRYDPIASLRYDIPAGPAAAPLDPVGYLTGEPVVIGDLVVQATGYLWFSASSATPSPSANQVVAIRCVLSNTGDRPIAVARSQFEGQQDGQPLPEHPDEGITYPMLTSVVLEPGDQIYGYITMDADPTLPVRLTYHEPGANDVLDITVIES